ncbi:UNVERIFIED_CONTAM: hypothetical protein FKN15_023086 [Acipenser sinensis]
MVQIKTMNGYFIFLGFYADHTLEKDQANGIGFDRPQYPRVLSASALRHLEAFRTLCSAALGAMLPQSLGASASSVPRELHATCFNVSTPQCFSGLCSGAFGGMLPQSLGTSTL